MNWLIIQQKSDLQTIGFLRNVDSVNTVAGAIIADLDDKKGLDTLAECIARAQASPRQFARLMGVDRSTMSLWLSGKRPVTSMAIRAALFCAMMSGVPVRIPNPSQYFFDEN